ncbi:MAG TPA: MBL fold metallo-hydrolase [Phycisphaeraceae bacterium]|nr:MBL fold metallo-hydrolase [Phycisphaeraceae bacterium]
MSDNLLHIVKLSKMTISLSLCVLGSGSSGNCSALVVNNEGERKVILIDLGLSRRQTAFRLDMVGISMDEVSGALITHLDTDHYSRSWYGRTPDTITVHMHRRHLGRAERCDMLGKHTEPFTGSFELFNCLIEPILVDHDSLGTCAFRIRSNAGDLGFITDCGRITKELIEHVHGVDVLAIESNYDPGLQLSSGRPGFLISRIMGGQGHLSNMEAKKAIRAIQPRREVVLLHLSRQCNHPDLIRPLYENDGSGLADRIVISSQNLPTRWVHLSREEGVIPDLTEPILF